METGLPVAEDAVLIEPSLLVKFPANREKYKEFRRIRALHCDFGAQSASEVNGFQLNSLCNGTGNFQTRNREFLPRNREFRFGDRNFCVRARAIPTRLCKKTAQLGSFSIRLEAQAAARLSRTTP